ncbi:MAG: two-component system, NtrC family, nitrogen regulation sensor histidine kinase NtrY [Pelagibacterales bacterium]|nr:two-component system, NtrC family, nitrogen regulation sensor histidine kinase NtrY [Pelagibacterales bacterium]
MIHIIKNNKWVIATSLICISFGLLTFFTFINQSFIQLNDLNLQILLFFDALLLIFFFTSIIKKTYQILKIKKNKRLGYQTSIKYVTFFSIATLLPSIIIAVFSLLLFNFGLQTYFEKKIKSVVNSSAEIAQNYVDQIRNSIEADILLMVIDLNNKSTLFYDKPNQFLSILSQQRLLRRLDEVHLIDSLGNVIMSTIVDVTIDFVPPPEEAFTKSLEGKPIRIIDPSTNRSSALVKLNGFIDTYLYIVKFMDPNVTNYLNKAGEAVSFYYTVQDQKTGIKITFVVIYILLVSLLLFLSVNIAISFASRLTRPIINLINASEKISSGDLTAKVPSIEIDNELKLLSDNFNSMIEKLKIQQDKLLLTERHAAWENVARKLAHEIKNPLTPIQLSIDMIREKYVKLAGKDDKNLSNYLNTIAKQIKDIEHLVTEFSDFARMPKPVLKKMNINKAILRAFNLYKNPEVKIKFTLMGASTEKYINGDEEQLNRVFINLIKNSVESINEKTIKNVDFQGKINIDIQEDSDYIYVVVLDDGVGFEKIDKVKMLTPYFTTKKSGTGLGLAIVSKIVADHNGSITFNMINNEAKVKIILPKYYG